MFAQAETPVILRFPDVPFDAGRPLKVAVSTSGFTSCQVQVQASTGTFKLQSREWGTEPDRPNSTVLTDKMPGAGREKVQVSAVMRPTRKKIPSMALVLSQDAAMDPKRLEQVAQRVRFVQDPAPVAAEGHFELDLSLASDVEVSIWRGESTHGAPLFTTRIPNVARGVNPVPWDLRTSRKAKVGPGRYLAWLVCSPKERQFSATNMFSTFGVV